MQVKNWEKFQHYKNRRPPWIRLYRELLDDPKFHALSGDAVKHLNMIWLIASEDETLSGKLPDFETLVFRLRTTEAKLKSTLAELGHFMQHDASMVLASGKQVATPEAETEGDTETEQRQNIPARTHVQKHKTSTRREPSQDARDLARYLLEQIRKTKPDVKAPNLESWATVMDRILRIDKRDPPLVRAVIGKLPTHDFWSGVVMSPNALRKNFDRIEIAVSGRNIQQPRQRPQTKAERQHEMLERREQESLARMAEEERRKNAI
jgi:hypothetical protein